MRYILEQILNSYGKYINISRGCKFSPDYFCYVCGYYIARKQVKDNITPDTK